MSGITGFFKKKFKQPVSAEAEAPAEEAKEE